ncbi:hypothetical protein BESB_048550 [Besnoitia besnoiti]|uniref:Uncharacterized protein n=1 Tax=Besnoitia besnoiti TaxID=94643 RepID=A0A2A9MLR3_BESBE|nr:hypothetical protein BESB_048550 [Besnoitia besnoiti]PFH36663.1 hypothetical protein BESB_048550 [Besnoitia besnoiti]
MESGLLPPSQHKHAGAEGERVSSPSRGGLSPAASGQSAESLSPRGSCALPLVSSRPSTSLATFSPSLAFSGCSAEATADRREAGAPEGAALCLGWTWEEAEVHTQDFLFFLNQERTCRFLFVVELELSLFLAKIASHRLKALRVHARLIRRQLATVRGSARDLARRTPASQGGKETQGEHRLEAERREGEAQDATATSAGLSRHDGDAGGGGGRMADCDRGEGRQSVVDLGRGGRPLPAASSEFASCGLSALDQASARSLRLHACGCECCPRLRCTYTLEFPPLSPLLRRLIHAPLASSHLNGGVAPLGSVSWRPQPRVKVAVSPPCPSPEGPTSTESAQPPSRRVSLSSSAERQQPRGLAGAPKKEICSAVRGGRGDLGPACAPADAALPTFLSNASTKEQCCWGDVVTGGGDAGRERIRCSALDASVVFGEIASPALSYEDFIPGLGALAADYERRKKREAEEKLERDEGQPSRRERGPQRPHGTESGALSDARREGKTPDSSPRLPASPGRGAAPTEEARGEKSRKCGKKDAREIAARQYPAHSALGSVCDSLDGLAREETPKKGREGSKSRGEDDEAGDEEGERQNGKKTDAPSSRAWLSLKDVMQDVERGKVEIIHLVLLRRAVKTGIRETLAALAHARQDMHALHLATRAELRDLASRPEATDERLWREGGGKQETETANGMQVEPGSQGGDGDTPGETRGRLGAAGGGGPETPERRGKASETQRKEDGLAPRQATSSSSASPKSTRGASPSAQNSGSLRGPAELGARDCEAGDAAQLKRTEGTETARPLTEKQSTAGVAGVRRGRGFHHYSPGGTQTAGCVGGGWTPPSSRPLSPSASPLSSASASRSSASNSASSASLVCRGGVEPHVDAKEDAPPSPGAHRGRLETVRGAARAGHQAAGDPRGPGDPGAAAEEAATQSRGKAHEPADARLHPQRAKPVCERAESQGAGARRGTARRGHPIHAGLASGPPPGGAVEDKGGTASDDLEEDEEEAEEDVYALRPLFCYNAFSPPPKTWGGFRSPGTHVQPFCSLCLPPPPVAASSASSFPSRHAPPASPASHRAAAAFARLTYHPSWVFPEVQALREESAALTAEQAPRGGGRCR